MMTTADLSLRFDPIYEPISRRFHEHPEQLADAFAKAWFKLLHRDMGPLSRYLGPWVPEPQLWQDPVPAVDHDLVGDEPQIRALLGDADYGGKLIVRHASEVVGMEDSPRVALRGKPDSSVAQTVNMVCSGEAQACVSAGNSGARGSRMFRFARVGCFRVATMRRAIEKYDVNVVGLTLSRNQQAHVDRTFADVGAGTHRPGLDLPGHWPAVDSVLPGGLLSLQRIAWSLPLSALVIRRFALQSMHLVVNVPVNEFPPKTPMPPHF